MTSALERLRTEETLTGLRAPDGYSRVARELFIRARTDFATFVNIFRPPSSGYVFSKLHKAVASIIQDVADGKINPRHCLSVPPQSGKSELTGKLAAAWALGSFPGLNVAYTSHSHSLCTDISDGIRDIIAHPYYKAVFPGTEVKFGSNRKELVKLTNGSVLRSVTAGSKLTGRRVDWAIIDDPHKGREEAESQVQREKIIKWYYADIVSRLAPNSAVFVIMCLTGDSLVSMWDGTSKRIDQLKIGDEVAQYKNGVRVRASVLNWKEQPEDDILEIKTGNNTVKCNARHPWLVARPDGTEWVKAGDLKKGYRIIAERGKGKFGTETIRKITALPKKQLVYDIQVSGEESFIADGLVSHNTRWHPEDLVGVIASEERTKLLEDVNAEGEIFTCTTIPAICENEEKDPLGRKEGESCFPEVRDEKFFHNIKQSLPSYEWDSQYQQRPRLTGAGNVDLSKIKYIKWEDYDAVRDFPHVKTIRHWDLAVSEKQSADFTAGALVSYDELEDKVYIAHITSARQGWIKMRKAIIDRTMTEFENYGIAQVGVEAVAGFVTAYQDLKHSLLGKVKVISTSPTKSKLSRATPWMNKIDAGRLYMVTGAWNKDFISQLDTFPSGDHDDLVDAVSGAWGILAGRKRNVAGLPPLIPKTRTKPKEEEPVKQHISIGQTERAKDRFNTAPAPAAPRVRPNFTRPQSIERPQSARR